MKRILKIAAFVIIAAALAAGSFMGYQWHLYNQTIRIDKHCSVILNNAGNSVLLTSEDGKTALLIDTKKGKDAASLARKVGISGLTIVNTHAHVDHTGGNDLYKNVPIIGGAVPPDIWRSESNGSRYPTDVLQPGEERFINMGSEKIRIRNTGCGHTGNDLIVYFENRKLLAAGDLLFPSIHPVLFPTSGGNVIAWIRTLDWLIADTAITRVIPGHGLPADRNALAIQREYFTSLADVVDNPEKISALKKKYRGYYAVPGLSSFEKTVRFIRREQSLASGLPENVATR